MIAMMLALAATGARAVPLFDSQSDPVQPEVEMKEQQVVEEVKVLMMKEEITPLAAIARRQLFSHSHLGKGARANGVTGVMQSFKVNGVKGYTTYRAYVDLRGCKDCDDVYALAGTGLTTPLRLPASWQFENSGNPMSTLGSNIGAPNPAYLQYAAPMAYDSWVCIGEKKAPTSIGLKGFNKRWNKAHDYSTTNGAIFFMDPAKDGPKRGSSSIKAGKPGHFSVLVGQFTVHAGKTKSKGIIASAMVKGSHKSGKPWGKYIAFTNVASGGGHK